jgi:histidine phosphotransfer protein HptB
LAEDAKAPGSTTDRSPWDVSAALRFAGGDRSLLVELVGIFLEDLPERLDRLRRAIDAGDTVEVSFVAHTLGGSLSSLGATTAAATARALEAVAEEGRGGAAREALGLLIQELELLAAFLADPRWKDQRCGS